MEASTFETIVPSRYITFTFPHPHLLRIAVFDSPRAAAHSAPTAALWVPHGRESDWIFTTLSGHLHLLSSSDQQPPLSRLILVGNCPLNLHPTPCNPTLQQQLVPLLLALTPKSSFGENGEIPEMPFLVYEDGVVKNSILEICDGPRVGEMLVEDVELECGGGGGAREFRRRLRFKRTPNLVQTQMTIRPINEVGCEGLGNVEFELDNGVLVQPYLSPMVAGISVVGSFLERRVRDGFSPKALCLGVGGGALVGFLSVQLGFEVVGVEEDEVVLDIAKRYFGLESNELVRVCVGDGIEFVKKLAKDITSESKFDVIMVDLDSSDEMVGVCAPPVEFIEKCVLKAARFVLSEQGVLVINTIPSSKSFYESLISEFQAVFEELYEIDVGNGENFVLISAKSKTSDSLHGPEHTFMNKFRSVVPKTYIDSIRKILKIE